MKKLLVIILMLAACTSGSEHKDVISFRVSKPYCILNFIEAATGNPGISSTLRAYIDDNIPASDTVFKSLLKKYKDSIDLGTPVADSLAYGYGIRSMFDMVANAAAMSDDIPALMQELTGVLPGKEILVLGDVLSAAEKRYDEVIWNKYGKRLSEQSAELSKKTHQLSGMFFTLKQFYGSSWSDDTQFVVNLYPIPGNKGSSSATAHGNVLSIGVLTGEEADAGKASVVVHEMCHMLYREQRPLLRDSIELYFKASPSKYSPYALSFIDEALATACGNGWAYRELSGVSDSGSWYNNEYINGFAKALYPVVSDYIKQGKTIDSSFVAIAIDTFAGIFPRSVYDYSILFNDMFIYHDGETHAERSAILNTIAEHFQVHSYMLHTPVAQDISIESLQSSGKTQLVIVHKNHRRNLEVLQRCFPVIRNVVNGKQDSDFYLSFLDSKDRAVVVVFVHDNTKLEKAFSAIKAQRYIDTANYLVEL